MKLTAQQIEDLLSILDRYTGVFLVHHVGADILTNQQQLYLQSIGVSLQDITRASYNVSHAYKFGILSDALGDTATKNMTYNQLKEYLSSNKSFTLSTVEKSALQSLKYQTATEVTKMTNRIKDDIKNQLVIADLKRGTVKHNKIITDAARKAIEDKRYVNEVVSQIGRQTGKWNQDLGRIADYVMHQSFDEGRAAGVSRKYGDDGLVYKDVYPGACPSCIQSFLTGGVGSEPKVFTLAELKANGTNIGKKQKDWLAVIGALHPYCRCTLVGAPDGMTKQALADGRWEWSGMVFKRAAHKSKRERPKVTVQIGNEIVKV